MKYVSCCFRYRLSEVNNVDMWMSRIVYPVYRYEIEKHKSYYEKNMIS